MRILSIGRPLAHPSIDNHSIFNAPAISDYEAAVFDPGGVLDVVREAVQGTSEFRTYSGQLVVNGASTSQAMSIADILRRRRDEVTRCLERGGVVVVFLYPQATMPEVVGFTGADRYCFLPAPPGLAWGPPLIQWSEGRTAVIADHSHPFARFLDAAHDDMLYRAVFDERAAGFAGTARVFARSGGGHPLGAEFSVLGGTVVFLPTPRSRGGNAGLAQGAAVEAAVRDILGRPPAGEQPPYWLSDQPVPGLAALEEHANSARERARMAEEQAAAAEHEAASLRRVRDVLWLEGRFALVPAVLRCCELLGFRVTSDDPPTLRSEEGELLVEVEGSAGTITMAPHYRLRARLDARLAEGQTARGLIVVNGERTTAPAQRKAPYPDALRVAAEATHYAVLTAPDLFTASMTALGGADTSALAAIRRRLFETDGVVTLESEK